MKKIPLTILTASLILLALTGAKADTITFSSDNLDFSQPINVLSNPSTTMQLGYNFSLYHNWLCVDIRGRSAQQSDSEVLQVRKESGIMTDKITILPSLDAGVRVKMLDTYRVDPYIFSLVNYTMINSSLSYASHSTSENISALGFRAGIGADILFQTQLPSWLFNMDLGYQYLPVPVTGVGYISMNGIFMSIGFGLSF